MFLSISASSLSGLLFIIYPASCLSNENLHKPGSEIFTGTINDNIQIVMRINRYDDNISGTYYYKKYNTGIKIKGSIDERFQFRLIEYGNKGNMSGIFYGRFMGKDRIEGTWRDETGTKSFPFLLNRQINSNTEVKIVPVGNSLSFSYQSVSNSVLCHEHGIDINNTIVHFGAWYENKYYAAVQYDYCSKSCDQVRGSCGGGTETEIAWMKFDNKLKLLDRKIELINSCLKNIVSVNNETEHTKDTINIKFKSFHNHTMTIKHLTFFKTSPDKGFEIRLGKDCQTIMDSEKDMELNEEAYFNRGRAYHNIYKYINAVNDYEKVVELFHLNHRSPENDNKTTAYCSYSDEKKRYVRALYYLGTVYKHGDNLPQEYSKLPDHNKAYELLLKSSEYGYTDAQIHLGSMYYNGKIIKQDYRKALYWYARSGRQGHLSALCMLGHMYLKGIGTLQNHEQAFSWYLEAAEAGEFHAQYHVGMMYKKGQGVAKDYIQAYKWLFLSSYNDFMMILNELAGYMVPDNIRKAQELAENWKPESRIRDCKSPSESKL